MIFAYLRLLNNNLDLIFLMQSSLEVKKAYFRIRDFVLQTPIVTCELLNKSLGHEIYFKLESFQHTGAFKVRGVFNYFLSMESLPVSVSVGTTGNNGVGLAFVSNKLGMKARIYFPECSADIKVEKAAYYGAEIIRTKSYKEAVKMAQDDVEKGFVCFPTSKSEKVIAGAGTLCYEALQQLSHIKLDGIFASCATGGMLAGCLLAKNLLSPETKLFGTEPQSADDGLRSIISGEVVTLSQFDTFADGLSVHSISGTTLKYLRCLDGFFLVEEDEILYWTKILNGALNSFCEPACAINMASVAKWLENKTSPQKILVIISGGNLSAKVCDALYQSESVFTLLKSKRANSAKFFDFQNHAFLQSHSLIQRASF